MYGVPSVSYYIRHRVEDAREMPGACDPCRLGNVFNNLPVGRGPVQGV